MKINVVKDVKINLEVTPTEFMVIQSLVGNTCGCGDFTRFCDKIYNDMYSISKKVSSFSTTIDCTKYDMDKVLNDALVAFGSY